MPDTVDNIVAKPIATDDQLTYLQVVELVPWAGNVRSSRSDMDVAAMALSIKNVGLLNPLLVKRIDNEWNVVAGVTRLKALISLKWDHVPCVVLPDSMDDRSLSAVSLAENTSRSAMSLGDTVRGLLAIFASGVTDLGEAAIILGQPHENAKIAAQLTRLVPDALAKLEKGKIGTDFALELSKLSDGKQRGVLRRLKDYSSYNDEGPDARMLRRDIAKERVNAGDVEFTEQQFLEAGGTVVRNLLGEVSFEPYSLVMELQRKRGQEIAEALKSKHKWVEFFESSASSSYFTTYISDPNAKNDPKKAGAVVLLTPDARIEIRTPVVRIEDQKAKEKAAKQKAKEKEKAESGEAGEDVSSGIRDMAAQYLADYTRQALIGHVNVALAVILSSSFRVWQRPTNLLAPTADIFMNTPGLKKARETVEKFQEDALAEGLSIDKLLDMTQADLGKLVIAMAQNVVHAYKPDDKNCLAVLNACEASPMDMNMASLPVLKRLTKEQLVEIGKQVDVQTQNGEPKGGLARRIELALEKRGGGWQPPGISYNG
jgi:ParB-like chromosome segregation protein Spo0J